MILDKCFRKTGWNITSLAYRKLMGYKIAFVFCWLVSIIPFCNLASLWFLYCHTITSSCAKAALCKYLKNKECNTEKNTESPDLSRSELTEVAEADLASHWGSTASLALFTSPVLGLLSCGHLLLVCFQSHPFNLFDWVLTFECCSCQTVKASFVTWRTRRIDLRVVMWESDYFCLVQEDNFVFSVSIIVILQVFHPPPPLMTPI